jgi:7-cyano-7-deazaguanine synthase
MAYELVNRNYEIILISYNYGQRHKKEIVYAQQCAENLGVQHHIVDLQVLSNLLGGSSLTSEEIGVPDGHYAEESMRITVVPNRNAIMINIATALAVSMKCNYVATGVHGGDHYIYPDCRPEFISAQTEALRLANAGFIPDEFEVLAPFVNISKDGIVKIGEAIGVPWLETWSCYKGGEIHCGSCGTCFERREAFALAGVHDPTNYETTPTFLDPR